MLTTIMRPRESYKGRGHKCLEEGQPLAYWATSMSRETRDLAATRFIEQLEKKMKFMPRDRIDELTSETDRLVNHQIIHVIAEDCRIYRHEWQQLARTALTLSNINAIRLLVVHLTTSGNEGLQWLDAEFCASIYNQAKALDHPELDALFDELTKLAEKAETVGTSWLTRHNVHDLIQRQDNHYVDNYPELFFRQPLFNLMADALPNSTAATYFASDHIKNHVYPQLQQHRLLPRRRRAIDAHYGQPHYLDTYEPLINDVKFTEPAFVANLTQNELKLMKQKQSFREYVGHVRLDRIVPKRYQISRPHAKALGMLDGDEPPLEQVERLLDSYSVVWERQINKSLIKQENHSESALMSGAITGIYESLEEMHMLLLLRLLKQNGDYSEFAKLIISSFINTAVDNDEKHVQLTEILPWRSIEMMMMNIIKRYVNTKLDVGLIWNDQYTQRFPTTMCNKLLEFLGACFVHRTMSHALSWMQAGTDDVDDWLSRDLIRIRDISQAAQEQVNYKFNPKMLNGSAALEQKIQHSKNTLLHYMFDRLGATYKMVPTMEMPMVAPPERCLIADEVHLKTELYSQPIHRIGLISQLTERNTSFHLGLTDFYRACPKSMMRPFVDAMDVYNRTAFVTNRPVMDVFRHIFESGGDITVGIPNHSLNKAAFIKAEKGLSPGDFREKLIQEEESLVMETNNALSTMYALGDQPYWMPNTIDYRGRLYPNAAIISHLNADKIRACHKFAEKKPLGKGENGQFSGFEWLLIHAMNVAEVLKKPTREEALAVGKKLIPVMIESATDPINGAGWWRTTERPFQTLAACFEIKAALDSGNVETFESNLPVYQDGTCNGYQHWSAIGRDTTGALASNVLGDKVC